MNVCRHQDILSLDVSLLHGVITIHSKMTRLQDSLVALVALVARNVLDVAFWLNAVTAS